MRTTNGCQAIMEKSRNRPLDEHQQKVVKERQVRREKEILELRDRLIFLLDDLAPTTGKYTYLESRTGISAARWQNLYLEKQQPTIEMILAISEYLPEYLTWLLTGRAPSKEKLIGAPEVPTDEEWHSFSQHRAWLRKSKAKHGD